MGNAVCPTEGGPIEQDGVKYVDVNKLVVRSAARSFPPPQDGTNNSGECMLFVEQLENAARAAPWGDFRCEAVATSSETPSVAAWAVQAPSDEILGLATTWPVKRSNMVSSWYSAQSLGFPFAAYKTATLHIEFSDQGVLKGVRNIPLQDVMHHRAVKYDLEAEGRTASKPCRLAFQILDSNAVAMQRRVVFFVRHGQSVWNAAQSKMQLHEMARTTDHPLSQKGRAQEVAWFAQLSTKAEALAARLAKAAGQGASSGGAEKPMLQSSGIAFCSSPLTRAIQTAVIALGPQLVKQAGGCGELTLMANAREKQNFGGLDTHSSKVGSKIVQGTLEHLRELYGEEEAEIVDRFSRLRFDTQEVQDRWWCEDQAESAESLNQRLEEFKSQLLYFPQPVVVVVGHSFFFRAFCRKFISEEFRVRHPDLAQQLSTKKLMNCGVLRLELDPRSAATGPIVSAELVLGTELEGDNSLMQCCSAPGNVTDQQLTFEDSASQGYRSSEFGSMGSDNDDHSRSGPPL